MMAADVAQSNHPKRPPMSMTTGRRPANATPGSARARSVPEASEDTYDRPEPPMSVYEQAAELLTQHNGVQITGAELYSKWKAIDAVLENMAYDQTQALIMIGLIARSNKHYQDAFPSATTLARYAKIKKEEAIHAALRALESPPFSVIRVTRPIRKGQTAESSGGRAKGRHNRYEVIPERVMNLIVSETEARKARKFASLPATERNRGRGVEGQGQLPLEEPLSNTPFQGDSGHGEGSKPLSNTPFQGGYSGGSDAEAPRNTPFSKGYSGGNSTPTPSEYPLRKGVNKAITPSKGGSNLSCPTDRSLDVDTTPSSGTKDRGQSTREVVLRPLSVDGAVDQVIDHGALHRALSEAAGAILDPIAVGMGLNDHSEVLAWLKAGASLELDVLPALRRVADKGLAKNVRTWRFFASSVTEHMARRVANEAKDARTLAEIGALAAKASTVANLPATTGGAAATAFEPLSAEDFAITDSGALRVHGPFRAELAKTYPRANIDAACDLVAGELVRYRREGADATKIKHLIRSRVAEEHAANAKAARWGKREAMPITGDLNAAMQDIFGKKGPTS